MKHIRLLSVILAVAMISALLFWIYRYNSIKRIDGSVVYDACVAADQVSSEQQTGECIEPYANKEIPIWSESRGSNSPTSFLHTNSEGKFRIKLPVGDYDLGTTYWKLDKDYSGILLFWRGNGQIFFSR